MSVTRTSAQGTATKVKLRTAADVISRLRWDRSCVGEEGVAIMIGYDDRINGPMEKNLEDFTGIEQGGDIPEHRIWYIRLDNVDVAAPESNSIAQQKRQEQQIDNCILWDRIGRVDRVFSSGNGANGPIPADTIQHVGEAVITLQRLEEEKMERKLLKQKQRARKARKRAIVHKETNASVPHSNFVGVSNTVERYSLKPMPWYSYSTSDNLWIDGVSTTPSKVYKEIQSQKNRKLVIVTWNVLFDLFDDETTTNTTSICDEENEEHTQRWGRLVDHLSHTNADVIALQEVTPRFAEILLSREWVMSNYSTTASPSNTTSVSPCGNLLLWRTSFGLTPASSEFGAFYCLDGRRNRSVITALKFPEDGGTQSSPILLIANVHLPADKKGDNSVGEQQTSNRDLARRRELSAIIGHLQSLEGNIRRSCKQNVVSMIVGDFNTADTPTDNFADGNFSGSRLKGGNRSFFSDAWPEVSSQPGYTYDPLSNRLAAKNCKAVNGSYEPKRIDRIFVARCWQKDSKDDGGCMALKPVSGTLLQERDATSPLSDHSGLLMEFEVPSDDKNTLLYRSEKPGHNAWAANAISTPDTLLGIILDDSTLRKIKSQYDCSSSLPIPHITLLHGFVELSSASSLALAARAIENAIAIVQDQIGEQQWSLTFDKSSLGIFEHNSSATLIGRPRNYGDSSDWLHHLYKTLRQSFRLCHEQETRHGGEWDPHVTLGSFGTPQAARTELLNILQEYDWLEEKQFHQICVYGLQIFRRNPIDGKFGAVSTIPFYKQTRSLEDFLMDGGFSAMNRMKGLCSPVLLEVERCCQEFAAANENLTASVQVYGSYLMNASLPEISDVDVVLKLQQIQPTAKSGIGNRTKTDRDQALSDIGSLLKSRHVSAKMRIRTAGSGAMLTMKLWPGAPTIDMSICFCDCKGQPFDEISDDALGAFDDTAAILGAIQECYQQSTDVVPIFEGALRIIKYWAYCRDIYGSQMGFLGGGGWAVLLAAIMCGGIQDETLSFSMLNKKVKSKAPTPLEEILLVAECSRQLVSFFFKKATELVFPITAFLRQDLINGTSGRQCKDVTSIADQALETANLRGSIAILAPVTKGNLGRNSTRSTAMTIRNELQRAATYINEKNSSIATEMFYNRNIEEFTMEFQSHIVYEISFSSAVQQLTATPSEIKGWGSMRVLHLIVDIEQRYPEISIIRPRGRVLRLPTTNNSSSVECSWLWLVGLCGNVSQVDGFLKDRLEEEQVALEKSSKLADPETSIDISCSLYLSAPDKVLKHIQV